MKHFRIAFILAPVILLSVLSIWVGCNHSDEPKGNLREFSYADLSDSVKTQASGISATPSLSSDEIRSALHTKAKEVEVTYQQIQQILNAKDRGISVRDAFQCRGCVGTVACSGSQRCYLSCGSGGAIAITNIPNECVCISSGESLTISCPTCRSYTLYCAHG